MNLKQFCHLPDCAWGPFFHRPNCHWYCLAFCIRFFEPIDTCHAMDWGIFYDNGFFFDNSTLQFVFHFYNTSTDRKFNFTCSILAVYMFEISMHLLYSRNVYDTLNRSLTLEAPLYLLPLNHCHIPHSTVNYVLLVFQLLPLVSRLHQQNFHPNHTQPTNTTHFSSRSRLASVQLKILNFLRVFSQRQHCYC